MLHDGRLPLHRTRRHRAGHDRRGGQEDVHPAARLILRRRGPHLLHSHC